MSQSNIYLPSTELRYIISNLNNDDIEDVDRKTIEHFACNNLCNWNEQSLSKNCNQILKRCFPDKNFHDKVRPQIHSTLLSLVINHFVRIRENDVNFTSQYNPQRLHSKYSHLLELNFEQEPSMVLMLTRFEAALHVSIDILNVSPRNKKGVLMTAAAILADHRRPYNSGGNPTRPTRNCLAIFQELTGLSPIKKSFTQSKGSKRTSTSMDDFPMAEKRVRENDFSSTPPNEPFSLNYLPSSCYTSEEDLESLDSYPQSFSNTCFNTDVQPLLPINQHVQSVGYYDWSSVPMMAEEDQFLLVDLFDDRFDELFSTTNFLQ